jgi:Insertion element 4 transposase N-terminal
MGRREQRQRLLPARLMVYFTLGMWIFGSLSYEEVLAEVLCDVPGLTQPSATQSATATAAAIGRARQRLGVEPFRLLFEQVTGPGIAAPSDPPPRPLSGGWRLLRLSSIAVEVPDTPANRVEFGRPARDPARPGAPRVQLSVLTDDCTHRIAAAAVGTEVDPGSDRRMAAAMSSDALVIVDGRPFSTALWTAVRELGADQLWCVGDEIELPGRTRLPDGSRLSPLTDAAGAVGRTVRVVDRAPADSARAGRARPPSPGRLVTSILDYRAASAGELAALYDRHRTSGYEFDWIEDYQNGDRLVLRSKSPDLVRQELYAMLCVHHAIGELVGKTMWDRVR